MEEFGQLVEDSAYSIEKREEVDSIPFVDEVSARVVSVGQSMTSSMTERCRRSRGVGWSLIPRLGDTSLRTSQCCVGGDSVF